MSAEIYPQLFDKINKTLSNKGENNHLYEKYKTNELRGYARQKFDEYNFQLNKFQNRILPPIIALIVFSFSFLILLIGLIEGTSELGFKAVYSNVPFLFWLLAVLAVLSIASLIILILIKKNVNIIIAEYNNADGKEVERLIQANLGVPSDAKQFYLFQRVYRIGKTRPLKVNCIEVFYFLEDNNVCFFWEGAILKIPKNECILAEVVESKTTYNDFTPSVDYKSPEIKQFKIKRNDNGALITNSFGRLIFQHAGEMWTIDVPPFSFETAKKIFDK